MEYSSGFLKDLVTVLNRKEAQQGKFGLDSAGIEWENMGCVHANVDWQKGKSGMAAGGEGNPPPVKRGVIKSKKK